MAAITFHPIGLFHGPRASKSALPRQGFLSAQSGYIEFEKGFDHKLGLTGLEDMTHVWLIYHFHKADSAAKPLVRPPRAPDKQIGVYATRSPYRPNGLGLTLARVEGIRNGRLYLSHVDLLDETPIFDIKPYVTDSDRAENPSLGWIDQIESWDYSLSELAQNQADWLEQNGLSEIRDVFEAQLGTNPLPQNRKRIEPLPTENHYQLAYRTWRILFRLDLAKRHSEVLQITSGYTDAEMADAQDPYLDKSLHRKFKTHFC